ncbi:hypothetical protein WMF38_20970 [Sorangium sp. So ce118]
MQALLSTRFYADATSATKVGDVNLDSWRGHIAPGEHELRVTLR